MAIPVPLTIQHTAIIINTITIHRIEVTNIAVMADLKSLQLAANTRFHHFSETIFDLPVFGKYSVHFFTTSS